MTPDDRDAQIDALITIIENLRDDLRRVEDTVHDLITAHPPDTNPSERSTTLAPWVWFTPPAAAEDDPTTEEDPDSPSRTSSPGTT